VPEVIRLWVFYHQNDETRSRKLAQVPEPSEFTHSGSLVSAGHLQPLPFTYRRTTLTLCRPGESNRTVKLEFKLKNTPVAARWLEQLKIVEKRYVCVFSLYKILFHFKALFWESIILLLPPPLHNLPYCHTIARPLRNIRPPRRPPPFMPYTIQYW